MNPYAARNFINLSQAYAKTGNFDAERGPLKEAITIYKNIYGKTSPLLAPLYQQLADNLKKTGNRDRALYYQDKARALTAPAP
jgi:tetratricopeptide (TPR) repeat protein